MSVDDIGRQRTRVMARAWLVLFVAANACIAWLGPHVAASVPKSHSAYLSEGTGMWFSRGFEGIFQMHALSEAPVPNTLRVVLTGDCMVASEERYDILDAALQAQVPNIDVYGFGWWGATVPRQAQFIRRALKESPEVDLVICVVNIMDCRATRPLFPDCGEALAVKYDTGLRDAATNILDVNSDNFMLVATNLYAQISPGYRYVGVFQTACPRLPSISLGPEGHASGAGAIADLNNLSEDPTEVGLETLDDILDMVASNGTRLCVLITPSSLELTERLYGVGQRAACSKALAGWASENDVGLVDLNDLLPSEAFYDGVHLEDGSYGLVFQEAAQGISATLGQGS